MTHEQREQVNSWEIIKVWMPLSIAVIGAAITYGTFTQKLSADDQKITTIEVKQNEYSVDIATIKEDLVFIKERVK